MCFASLPGADGEAVTTTVVLGEGPVTAVSPSTDDAEASLPILKLSFRAGGLSEFVKALKASLAERAWETAEAAEKVVARPKPADQPNPGLGGIASIMRSVEQSNQRVGTSVSEAFNDLDALMAKAADMVKLAESISIKVAQSTSPGGDESSEMVAFRSYLIDLGIASPVTKKSTGDMYSTELARQLAEFLERILARHGGMMALTDLYCLFNRARGVALVSPADLRTCCNLFPELRLPYRVRQFESGLLVVQSASHRDEETVVRVLARVKEVAEGVGAADLARLEKVSVVLAAEQLLVRHPRPFA
ncbi:Vacuolar protein-sorting-associated protein 36 [Thoreauomyces humboldtii]|nr:Vacuolar protein-sorting-associated protein 36 [Thoreauomyces humboldtii]